MTEQAQSLSVPPDPHDRPLKPCKVCAEFILQEARKCTKCDTYQDWRSYIGFSSTVLALTTALLSVAGISIPLLVTAVKGNNSELSAFVARLENGRLEVVVFNNGDRPGGVARAYLVGSYPRTGQSIGLPLNIESTSDNSTSIEPQKNKSFKLSPRLIDKGSIGRFAFGQAQRNCSLEVSFANFSGNPKPQKRELDCSDLWHGFFPGEKYEAPPVPPDTSAEKEEDSFFRSENGSKR
jgi:hypothetical protein